MNKDIKELFENINLLLTNLIFKLNDNQYIDDELIKEVHKLKRRFRDIQSFNNNLYIL